MTEKVSTDPSPNDDPTDDRILTRATVVSICPFPISEMKPGMTPGYFHIKASDKLNPIRTLSVIDSHYFERISATDRRIRIFVRAEDVAESIVNDFCRSQLGYNEESSPGLFWVRGSFTASDIKSKFTKQLIDIATRQKNWFLRLVQEADDDWSQFKQHKMITSTARLAAESLGFKREWLVEVPDVIEFSIIKCPGCAADVPDTAVVCQHCQVILQPDKYAKLKFAGATK